MDKPRALAWMLVAAAALLGFTSIESAPPGTHIGYMWPVGLVAGAALLQGLRTRWLLILFASVLGGVSFYAGGFAPLTALGYGIAIGAEALIVARIVRPTERLLALGQGTSMLRYGTACASAAAAGAGITAITAMFTGVSIAWMIFVAAFFTDLTSLCLLVALFLPAATRGFAPQTRSVRLSRWAVVLTMAIAAFTPTVMPVALFLLVPALAWSAMRAPMREVLAQLVAVGAIGGALTLLGVGPFAEVFARSPLNAELRPIPLQAFLLGCSMVCVPFTVLVGRQRWSNLVAEKERETLQQIMNSATGAAIIGVDEDGRIVHFNPGAERMLGYPALQVLDQTPAMFHTHAEVVRQAAALGVPATFASVAQACTEPGVSARDWRVLRKDGSERTWSMTFDRVLAGDGEVNGYVSTAEDITDRVHAQEALEAALAAERRAVERLQEIDVAKDSFVSSVSHELRTPITNIVGYLELLIDGLYGEPTEPQAAALARIDVNSKRLLDLIDDLLSMSRLENLEFRLDNDVVDLRLIVHRAAEALAAALTDRDLRLEIDVPDHPVLILGDAMHLERMSVNLATNAVKFTPDGGVVTLRVGASPPSLEVQDTGVGVSEDDQALLFNRFYRAESAYQQAIPGSGLGLSIVRSIAERHGAEVDIESELGHGSRFRVSFHEPADANRALHDPATSLQVS